MSIKRPKIFLDSGDPEETKKAKGLLGYLDGQTTNPTLVSKNPTIIKIEQERKKITEQDIYDCYKDIITEIDHTLAGPLSVEVYGDWNTKDTDMLKQAEKMVKWGHNIYIKFPTTNEGVKAAHQFVTAGGKANMTLVFDQMQAAAVYSATVGAPHNVFVSPFLGRWDDRGYEGLDLVKNILKMYKKFGRQRNVQKNHMEVLAASIRNLNHFYSCIFIGADILTVPLKILNEWVKEERWIPDERYRSETGGLKSIKYEEITFAYDFNKYDIKRVEGSLLDEGIEKFVSDWEKLITT
jgi:transaldolase